MQALATAPSLLIGDFDSFDSRPGRPIRFRARGSGARYVGGPAHQYAAAAGHAAAGRQGA